MTPDDTPVPGDDAIARAARDGLRHLAGSHAPTLDWTTVASRARRVRQRRVVALVAAGAIVLASAGAAIAATGNRSDHVNIAGHGAAPATTSTTDVPTSTTTPEQTTTTPSTPNTGAFTPGTDESTTTVPVPVAQPDDLTGTITTPSTWIAEHAEPVSLTIRNASDHAVTLPYGLSGIGLYADFFTNVAWGSSDDVRAMAPGEERTFTWALHPDNDMIGTTPLRAAFVRGIVMDVGGHVDSFLDRVPTVMITTIPPEWTPGDALDPAQGHWRAEISAEQSQVAVGDAITLHINLTNLEDAPHQTASYGLLGVFCNGTRGSNGAFLNAAALNPGSEQSFDVQYTPTDYQVGPLKCSVGIAFMPDPAAVSPRDNIETNTVTVTVLPLASATTTSPTTTTTSPEP